MYTGRGWDKAGAHTRGYNHQAISIAFMGNYMTTKPSTIMLTAAQNLIQCGITQVVLHHFHTLTFYILLVHYKFCIYKKLTDSVLL